MPEVLTRSTAEHQPSSGHARNRGVVTRHTALPRVVIVARNRLQRDAIEEAFIATSTLEVVAAVEVLDDLWTSAVQAGMADVLLVDMPSPGPAIDHVRRLAVGGPALSIVLLDVGPAGAELLDLLEAGVAGFVPQCATVDDILCTTWAVLAGTVVMPRSLTRSLLAIAAERTRREDVVAWRAGEPVTGREAQIVALVAEGLTNKEIAARLNIATFTVKSHVHNVLQKLGLQTRAQIARSFLLTQTPARALSARLP